MSRDALALVALSAVACVANAADSEMRLFETRYRFEVLLERVERAVERHGLGVVARASASRGAAARGVRIPGNAVIMVFRNDLAVRLLAANLAAGIEAPLRLYLTENGDGTASLSYRRPRAVFAPYGSAELDRIAGELEVLLDRIARDASGG